MRAALDELVREGFLDRRRGSGTFVREPKIAQELTMTSFSEEMRRRGMRPAARRSRCRRPSPAPISAAACTSRPPSAIVVAKRLRLADGETMAIETLHVPESRVPGLTPKDLDQGSFYELLSERYGIEIVGGIQTIEPTVTNEEESEALGVPLHSPAFLFERTTRVRDRRHRRVRALDLPGRPLPARDRAQPARAHRLGAGVPAPGRARDAPVTERPARRASQLLAEIREQPAALARLLEHAPEFAAVARSHARSGRRAVRLVGHGSSDNAASYGVYAFGLLPGWTALRDSISLSVYYGAELDLARSCVVALSQSGRTPDVVEYAQKARAPGALTVALTNDADSALAEACELVLPLGAGAEHAVAATKTYTTQVAALALLAGSAAGEGARLAAGIRATAELISELLPDLERARLGGRDGARVRRPHVRDRARARVRDRARDLAQAARDLPRGGRAAHRHRPRARARGRARRALPRLGDRLRRRRASPPCARRPRASARRERP